LPRPLSTDLKLLKNEARAIELLAEEAEVPPSRLETYWTVSTRLINLVTEIDELEQSSPGAGFDDPYVIDLRRRLRAIAGELTSLTDE
jgi:hypothetical protein